MTDDSSSSFRCALPKTSPMLVTLRQMQEETHTLLDELRLLARFARCTKASTAPPSEPCLEQSLRLLALLLCTYSVTYSQAEHVGALLGNSGNS